MRPDQERIKNLLIDTVTLLCKNSVQFEEELHVEGLLGVSVDKKDVFFIHISKEFSNSPPVDTVTQCVADSQEESRQVDTTSETDSSQCPPNVQRSSGEISNTTPDPQQRLNIKTEPSAEPEEECLIVENPQIKLEGRANSAEVVAGQRRALKRTSTADSQQHSSDSNISGGYGVGSENADSFDSTNYGEPTSKRRAEDQTDDSFLQEDSEAIGSTPWPSVAGPIGFDPSQSFQDSDSSQLEGSQPGCSTWPSNRGVSDSALRMNPNTQQKTEQVIKKFSLWLLSESRIEEDERIETLAPETLDHHIACFFLTAKKNTGEDYEPDTLTGMHRAIERHLRDMGYEESLVTSPKFATSRSVLEAKRKKLKVMGLGKKPNKATPLTEEHVEMFWEANELGTSDARILQNTVFFLLTLGFKMSTTETRDLQWGDVTLHTPNDGTAEFLEYNRETMKRRITPMEFEAVVMGKPRIYGTGTKRCPVEIYKIYKSHRPPSMNSDDSPFFLTLQAKKYAEADKYGKLSTEWVWYSYQPLGKNTMLNVVSSMAKNAGIPGNLRNASLCK